MRIILASMSPRRHELLRKVVPDFDIIPSTNDETAQADNAQMLVATLAYDKASEVLQSNIDSIVIGCDTVVELNGTIYGKPRDYQQAFDMLRTFAGTTHNVWTGVCIRSQHFTEQFVECTKVIFKPLSDADIESYIANHHCYDKAGGYGIQDGILVDSIVGSYDNVMGLPTETLATVLSRWQYIGE